MLRGHHRGIRSVSGGVLDPYQDCRACPNVEGALQGYQMLEQWRSTRTLEPTLRRSLQLPVFTCTVFHTDVP